MVPDIAEHLSGHFLELYQCNNRNTETMAAPSLESNWLVQIPNQSGAHVAQARKDSFAAHMSYNKTHIEAGRMVLAGPLVESLPEDGQPAMSAVITGSIMVWKAGAGEQEQLEKWLGDNPFATSGVWDLSKMSCTPFLCGVRKGL